MSPNYSEILESASFLGNERISANRDPIELAQQCSRISLNSYDTVHQAGNTSVERRPPVSRWYVYTGPAEKRGFVKAEYRSQDPRRNLCIERTLFDRPGDKADRHRAAIHLTSASDDQSLLIITMIIRITVPGLFLQRGVLSGLVCRIQCRLTISHTQSSASVQADKSYQKYRDQLCCQQL